MSDIPIGQLAKACYAQAESIGKLTASGFIVLPECPFCGGNKKAGIRRVLDGTYYKHRFNCFVCGKKVQSPEDWQELAARMAAPMQYQPTPKRQQAAPKTYPWQADPMRWHSRYTNDRNAVIDAWQAYKPLSEQTIVRYQLGYGAFSRSQFNHDDYLICEHPRLMYANIENADNQASAFRGRIYKCNCDPKKHKWLSIMGSQAWLWGQYHILKHAHGKRLIIGENPVDGMLAMQAMPGVLAVASTAGAGTFPDAWLQLIAAAKPKSVLIWLDNDLIGNPNEETRELLLARWIAKMRAKGVEPTPQMIEHQRTKAMGPKLVKALQALGVPTRAKEWASGTVPKMDMGQYLIEQGAF